MLALAPLPQAQGTPPAAPLTLVARDGRRPVPTTVISGQEVMALDDIATLFSVSVSEDALAGGLTISYRGRTIVASLNQPMVSVNGRFISLASPVVRSGGRVYVPLDFLSRGLAQIYDQRIELRRASRLLIVGDVRVPRVTARLDAGPPARATMEIAPGAPVVRSADDSRIDIRIDADALDLALPPDGAGPIAAIRAGEQPTTVSVVIAPGAGTPRTSVSAADALTRVVVEVPSDGLPAESSAAPGPEAAPTVPAGGGVPLVAAPAFDTVIIDPGHGGQDIGVRGVGGTEEKQLTLDVARRLRALIETRLGLRVVLTREDDRAVGLDERAAVANNSKGDLFLSLHANAAPTPTLAGAEVLYLRVDPGEAARGAVEGPILPVLGGGARRIDIVRWDLAQARHLDSSAMLATILEEELRRRNVVISPRRIQQAPMRVLTAANMPAALVEIAYLTNPGQERESQTDDFRGTVAQALYEAVARYRVYAEEGAQP